MTKKKLFEKIQLNVKTLANNNVSISVYEIDDLIRLEDDDCVFSCTYCF